MAEEDEQTEEGVRQKRQPYIPWGSVLGRDRGNGKYYYARNAYTPFDEKLFSMEKKSRPSSASESWKLPQYPSGGYSPRKSADPAYTRFIDSIDDTDAFFKEYKELQKSRSSGKRPSISPDAAPFLPSTVRFRNMTIGGPGHSEFSAERPASLPNVRKSGAPWSSIHAPVQDHIPTINRTPKASGFTTVRTHETLNNSPQRPSLEHVNIQPGNGPVGPFGIEFKLWLPGGTNTIPIFQERPEGGSYWSPSSPELVGPQFNLPGVGRVGFEPKIDWFPKTKRSISGNRGISRSPSPEPSVKSVLSRPSIPSIRFSSCCGGSENGHLRVSTRPAAVDKHPGYDTIKPLSCNEINCMRESRASSKSQFRHPEWDKILGNRGKVVSYGRPTSPSVYSGDKKRVSFDKPANND